MFFSSSDCVVRNSLESLLSKKTKKCQHSDTPKHFTVNIFRKEPQLKKIEYQTLSILRNSEIIDRQMDLSEYLFKISCNYIGDIEPSQNIENQYLQINVLTAGAMLEKTIKLVEKCKGYENQLKIQEQEIKEGTFKNKHLFESEVLKEYEKLIEQNAKLQKELNDEKNENMVVKNINKAQSEQIKIEKKNYKSLLEDYDELYTQFQDLSKKAFTQERRIDELINLEQAEISTLRHENEILKNKISKLNKKNLNRNENLKFIYQNGLRKCEILKSIIKKSQNRQIIQMIQIQQFLGKDYQKLAFLNKEWNTLIIITKQPEIIVSPEPQVQKQEPCKTCEFQKEKADQILELKEPDTYNPEMMKECNQVIDFTNAIVEKYSRYLKPISLNQLTNDENPYTKKEQKLNLRDFFHLENEESEEKKCEHQFSSSQEVQNFFMQVGKSLRECNLGDDLEYSQLTPSQQDAFNSLKSQRFKAYQSLNNDIYTSFAKLFFYMNYQKQICEEQYPIYSYYKQNITTLKHAYYVIRNEGAKIQQKCQSQEKVLADLGYKYRKQELKIKSVNQQSQQYKKNLNQIEQDFQTINKDRKLMEKQILQKNIEIQYQNNKCKSLEKEKQNLLKAMVNLREFFDQIN